MLGAARAIACAGECLELESHLSPAAASYAFLAGFALALGFHRHRAAQLAGLLGLLALGVDAGSLQLREAALRLLPWLVLGCSLMPEPRLLSRRHGALLLVVGSLLLVAVYGPPLLLAMPVQIAGWPLSALDPGRAAGLLLLLAGGACAVRFLHRFQPLEAGLAVTLLLAAAGAVRPTELSVWLLAAAAALIGSVLFASHRMAFVDPLTGLPNRRALDETLNRLSGGYSLAMVDIDHFKAFNDQHGHAAGDSVLRNVAARLRQTASGAVFRYGGEEFCIVYRGLDVRQAGERLERARAAVQSLSISLPAQPQLGGKRARPARRASADVTVSAGVAGRSSRRNDSATVLKAADQALYQAKSKGRNRVELAA